MATIQEIEAAADQLGKDFGELEKMFDRLKKLAGELYSADAMRHKEDLFKELEAAFPGAVDKVRDAIAHFNEVSRLMSGATVGELTAPQPTPVAPAADEERGVDGARPAATSDDWRTIGNADHVSFPRFFKSVAESFVAAQQQLDAESRRYLLSLRGNPELAHVLPSVFKIPKVSADIRFAMEASTSKQVGLIFFRDRTEAKESHQQSVQFEIVAVPPPQTPPPVPDLPQPEAPPEGEVEEEVPSGAGPEALALAVSLDPGVRAEARAALDHVAAKLKPRRKRPCRWRCSPKTSPRCW